MPPTASVTRSSRRTRPRSRRPRCPGAPTGRHGDRQHRARPACRSSRPVSNGGSAITGYTVTSSPGGFTGTCVTSPCAVTGLTNGTSYTFTVHATNAIGNSVESAASTAVNPGRSVPGAPTGPSRRSRKCSARRSPSRPRRTPAVRRSPATPCTSRPGRTDSRTTALAEPVHRHWAEQRHALHHSPCMPSIASATVARIGRLDGGDAGDHAGSAARSDRLRRRHPGLGLVHPVRLQRRRGRQRLHRHRRPGRFHGELCDFALHGHRSDQRRDLHLHRASPRMRWAIRRRHRPATR